MSPDSLSADGGLIHLSLYSDLLNQSLLLALFMSSFSSFSLRYKGAMIHFCLDVLKGAHVNFNTSVQYIRKYRILFTLYMYVYINTHIHMLC